MAIFYLYRTDIGNTLISGSTTSFAPLPPNTGEIFSTFLPVVFDQALYYYRESGGTIIENTNENILAGIELFRTENYSQEIEQVDDAIAQASDFFGFGEPDVPSVSATTEVYTDVILSGFTKLSGNTQNDLAYISGVTDQNTSDIQANDADIAFISGVTDSNFNLFTGFTASTVQNELFLISTANTSVNTISQTAIPFQQTVIADSAYSVTGGTVITILEAGDYELSYNVTIVNGAGSSNRSIGTYIILNGNTTLNNTASAAPVRGNNNISASNLAPVTLTFAANDELKLVAFRSGSGGTINAKADEVTLSIRKKDTLR